MTSLSVIFQVEPGDAVAVDVVDAKVFVQSYSI